MSSMRREKVIRLRPYKFSKVLLIMNRIEARKTSAGIAVAMVSLFDAADMRFMINPVADAANFGICLPKPLERSYGYALRGLDKHLHKI